MNLPKNNLARSAFARVPFLLLLASSLCNCADLGGEGRQLEKNAANGCRQLQLCTRHSLFAAFHELGDAVKGLFPAQADAPGMFSVTRQRGRQLDLAKGWQAALQLDEVSGADAVAPPSAYVVQGSQYAGYSLQPGDAATDPVGLFADAVESRPLDLPETSPFAQSIGNAHIALWGITEYHIGQFAHNEEEGGLDERLSLVNLRSQLLVFYSNALYREGAIQSQLPGGGGNRTNDLQMLKTQLDTSLSFELEVLRSSKTWTCENIDHELVDPDSAQGTSERQERFRERRKAFVDAVISELAKVKLADFVDDGIRNDDETESFGAL